MHAPDGRPTAHIHYLHNALALQKVSGVHTSVPALADKQNLTVPWDLPNSPAKLAERNVFRALCVAAVKFPRLPNINQNRSVSVANSIPRLPWID